MRRGADEAVRAGRGRRGAVPVEAEVRLSTREPKRIRVNGAARRLRGGAARRRLHTLAFTPDRLAVVKGGPATRRAYFDRVLARRSPRPGRRCRPPTAPRSGSATPACAASPRACPTHERSSRGRSRSWSLAARAQDRTRGSGARAARTTPFAAARRRARARVGARSATTRIRRPRSTALDGAARPRTSSAAPPGSARTSTRSASSPATATSGRSARRASSGWPCSRSLLAEAELLASQGGVPPLLLLDDALSELDATAPRS